MTTASVLSAFPVGRESDALTLVFEYMAATQAETGRPVPAGIGELPAVLQRECSSLQRVYSPPGVFLIADLGTQPAGCVGLAALPGGRTAEVRRLYVRPAHRGNGIARTLMSHAHDHAARHGMTRLILDVLPRPHRRHQLLPPPRLHRNRALRDRVARPDDLHGTGRH